MSWCLADFTSWQANIFLNGPQQHLAFQSGGQTDPWLELVGGDDIGILCRDQPWLDCPQMLYKTAIAAPAT